ncbi:MAG: FtsX-like permease family protein [Cellulosilyticum sp.]|nr:FtsX-like permease family protein [Cellulosilyticum sp.]
MHKPLGYFSYLKGNKAQVFKYNICLLSCMVVLGIIKILLVSQNEELIHCNLKYEYMSQINFKTCNEEIKDTITEIAALEEVEAIYPCQYTITNCNTLFAGLDETTYLVDEHFIKEIMRRMDAEIVEGQMPQQDSGRALISSRVKEIKKYTDSLAIDGNKDVYYEGIYKSSECINYVPTTITDYTLSYLILPVLGREIQMNEKINSIIQGKAILSNREWAQKENTLVLKSVNENFNIIMIIITLMTALTAGVLSYLHYRERQGEIGLLSTLGYSHQWIIKRITKEVIISTTMAALGASGFLGVFCKLFNTFINEPRGYALFRVDTHIILLILTIALFMMAFSSVPIWMMLSQKQWIYSIERKPL